jgi:hypothetical protein
MGPTCFESNLLIATKAVQEDMWTLWETIGKTASGLNTRQILVKLT